MTAQHGLRCRFGGHDQARSALVETAAREAAQLALDREAAIGEQLEQLHRAGGALADDLAAWSGDAARHVGVRDVEPLWSARATTALEHAPRATAVVEAQKFAVVAFRRKPFEMRSVGVPDVEREQAARFERGAHGAQATLDVTPAAQAK